MGYKKREYKILLTGGGTGGSVAPLLAIAEEIRNLKFEICNSEFLWLGTKNGPEIEMIKEIAPSPCQGEGWGEVKFKPIFSGKFRRYFSLRNFIDLIFIFLGFIQSFFIILKSRPNLVMSAGSFVSVPVVWAAWLLRVPVLIHQQDVRPGLANKLMAPFAKVITVTFEKSLADYGDKAVWTGNPVREEIGNWKFEIGRTKERFGFKNDLPVVLIIGGGTGALAINKLVEQSAKELIKFCKIILITGKDKNTNFQFPISNFQFFEFLNAQQMGQAYASANIIVSRCGMGVLTELSYLGKPAILIPIPDSHQEDNAEIFRKKQAAIVLNQKELTAEKLVENIKNLLNNQELQNKLSNNIKRVIKRGANEKIVDIINNIISRN